LSTLGNRVKKNHHHSRCSKCLPSAYKQ